jgi:cell division protease FtsH
LRKRLRKRTATRRPTERLADVAGHEEAKMELREVVEMLRSPARYALVGARAPAGVLLTGAPGLGKTLLARAVAGEAGAAFVEAAGSSFVEVWVGQGARRVRDLFASARARAPCIVFIDELDAVGGARSADDCSERRQTLEQLLVELDGGSGARNKGVVVIAATNRPEDLDAALVRAGRFDVHVRLSPPDARAREAILQLHLHARGRAVAARVDLADLAARTRGLSGAALAGLVNAAAVLAVRGGRAAVAAEDLDEALDRALLGIACRDKRDARETQVVAHHEAGHAVVAARLLADGELLKVSIVARGEAGGFTALAPPSALASRDELERRLAVTLAGRAAEERAFGARGVTAGASADLAAATAAARDMVERCGLGATLAVAGPAAAEASRAQADREVAALLTRAHARAARVLNEDRRALAHVVQALVERETLSGAEVARALLQQHS